MGTNVSTNYITCPADANKTLGIKLPFLVMILKNLKKYFTFEVQVLDDKNIRRRFRASNYQSTTRVKPFICTMPMRLDEGWNQIQFNLSDFTRRAYGTNYIETLRVQIHANCRLRRIYFSDRLYSEEELPPEFKLFLPVQKGQMGEAPTPYFRAEEPRFLQRRSRQRVRPRWRSRLSAARSGLLQRAAPGSARAATASDPQPARGAAPARLALVRHSGGGGQRHRALCAELPGCASAGGALLTLRAPCALAAVQSMPPFPSFSVGTPG